MSLLRLIFGRRPAPTPPRGDLLTLTGAGLAGADTAAPATVNVTFGEKTFTATATRRGPGLEFALSDIHEVVAPAASTPPPPPVEEVAAPDASFEDLEAAITADVGLPLKLLRYVNSAFFALPRSVESVREATARPSSGRATPPAPPPSASSSSALRCRSARRRPACTCRRAARRRCRRASGSCAARAGPSSSGARPPAAGTAGTAS
jgi:HDOD domain